MSDITSYLSTTLRKKIFNNTDFEEEEEHGQSLNITFWNRFVLSNIEIREFNRMIKGLESSAGLLNPSESKSMFFAMRRLFYCCIRSSNAENRNEDTDRVKENNSEIELSSIVIDSKYKIKDENLNQIHLGNTSEPQILGRKENDPDFRYDKSMGSEGISNQMKEELERLFIAMNLVESASKTVTEIFFNIRESKQLAHFKLLLLNFVIWGSYKPISALQKREVDIKNPTHTQKLSIVRNLIKLDVF